MLLSDKKIKFVPLNNTGNECHAKVFLVKDQKTVDIAKALVDLGFAKTVPLSNVSALKLDDSFKRYHSQLRVGEFTAKSFRRGCWHQLPENYLKYKLRSNWEKLLLKMKPKERRIPALVR